jgi:beta-xylosidase
MITRDWTMRGAAMVFQPSKMRTGLRWLSIFILVCGLPAFPWLQAPAADVYYQNPVISGDHPDPSIIRVGHDYWATATSSEWGPEFQLLHSTDLVNWRVEGVVFPHRPAWAAGNFWAPEISEYKGKFFVYYVGREKDGPLAVAVATADKPSGPYTDQGPMIAQEDGSIDPAPTTDEHGNRYLVWKEDGNSRHVPSIIWAQALDESGTKLIGEKKELIRNDADWEGAVVEGPYVLRRGDWFYLFYSGNGCCGPGCNYAFGVARAHSLLGPWEKDPANPIIAGNDHWKCPGHGSLVEDDRGRYWLLYHGYSTVGSVFTGREAILDQVKFGADDWPTVNDGKGSSARALSPFGAKQRKFDLSFFDDFRTAQLRPGWQWPQDNEPDWKLEGGRLVLASRAERGTNVLGAVLARATTTANYSATATVDIAGLKPGSLAGLWAFGDSANAIGLTVGGNKLTLWRSEHGELSRLQETEAPKASKLYLRLVAADGFRFHFLDSANGVKWIPIEGDLTGRNLPPWDRSIRVALSAGGVQNAQVVFDELRLMPATNKVAN